MREKWSINRLCEETLIDRRTIKKILGNTSPIDNDGKSDFYYLSDFIEAIQSATKAKAGSAAELIAEKVRDTRESADGKALANEEKRGIVVEIADLCRRLEPIYVAFVQIIHGSKLSDEDKAQLLERLHSIHSIVRPRAAETERNGDSPALPEPQAAPAA